MRTKLSHLKEKAISMRQEGCSYGQIKKALGLKSKGTISSWLKDVVLSEESSIKLRKNNELAIKRGLHIFNKQRAEKIRVENESSNKMGAGLIPKLNKRDLLLIGTALYWAEGTKSWTKTNSSRFSFANSDPEMIKVCMRFLREILKIEDSKIGGGIHLYPTTNVELAREFWSEITGISKSRFYVIHQVSRAGQNLRKKILPYGTLHIKAGNRLVFFKVKGLIDGLVGRINTD